MRVNLKKIQQLTKNVDILSLQETYWDAKKAEEIKKYGKVTFIVTMM